MNIKEVRAREILDSRANPTVEAKVILESGEKGVASAPSGASTGAHEAHELRDGDKRRYKGKGVKKAVNNIAEHISPAIKGIEATRQREIDEKMLAIDGTKSKSKLGANAILPVSLAVARAAASASNKELYEYLSEGKRLGLPTPMLNLINGGAHATNNLDIQEFMIVPHGLDLPEAIRAGGEIYHTLKQILIEKELSSAVGDEGGFAPDLSSDEEAIELLCRAIKESGYSTDKVGIALDVASSEWYENGGYVLPKRGKSLSKSQLIDYYVSLCDKYPIISIEDGMAEDDFDGWRELTTRLGNRIMLVGDDLFVTNIERLQIGISEKMANAILIKPNQIGTLSETLDVIKLAREAGYKFIISHRSGETCDTSIADIAVATDAKFIKAGAPCRGERVAKYNRLLEIYENIK